MAPPSLKSWLRTFIRHEVDKTLDWKRDRDAIRADDGRQIFSDDGSNFRSYVTRLEDGKNQVQIIEVLSTHAEFAEVRISDGQTKVRARLPKDTISRWEHDAGEEFGPETKGDVVQLKELIVVSTSFGPSDGFVWLDIQQIEYCYHLRKLYGQPVAVDQDRHLKLLIDDIAELRKDELATGDSSNVSSSRPEAPASQLQHEHVTPVKIEVEESSSAEAAATVHSSHSPIAATQHEVNVPAIEVDSPSRRKLTAKKKHPRLEQDGFEVQQGVNLAAPITARAESSNIRSHDGNPGIITTKPAALLGLLNRKRALDDTVKAHEQQSDGTIKDRITETPARPTKIRETSMGKSPSSITHSPSRPNTRERRSPSSVQKSPRMTWAGESSNNSNSNVIETQLPHTVASNPVSSLRREIAREASPIPRSPSRPRLDATKPRSNQLEQQQTIAKPAEQPLVPSPSARKPPSCSYENGLKYGHRNIPANQKKLVDSRSSWFPSLPGERFPVPNVPMELLLKWSEPPKRAASPDPAPPSSPMLTSPRRTSPTVEQAQEPHPAEDQDEVLPDADTTEPHFTSDTDEEEAEEFAFEDWPPSSPPLPKGHLPPPNSSPPLGIDYANPIQSSAGDNLAISPPRPLPVRTSPKKHVNLPLQSSVKKTPQKPPPGSPQPNLQSPAKKTPQTTPPARKQSDARSPDLSTPSRPPSQLIPSSPIRSTHLQRPAAPAAPATPAPPTPKPSKEPPSAARAITPPRHFTEINLERRRAHFRAERERDRLEKERQEQEQQQKLERKSRQPEPQQREQEASRQPVASRPSQETREILGLPVMAPRVPEAVPPSVSQPLPQPQQEPLPQPQQVPLSQPVPPTRSAAQSLPQTPSAVQTPSAAQQSPSPARQPSPPARPWHPPPPPPRTTYPPPTTPFEEFYQSLRAIKPGGAWARPRNVHGREGVDVLGWKF